MKTSFVVTPCRVIAAAAALDATPLTWAQVTFTPVHDLPGGSNSCALYGVSGDGSTAVGQGTSHNGYEAMRWRAGQGVVGLGDLEDNQFFSDAGGASFTGEYIVGRGFSGSGSEAFRWSASDGMIGLGDLPGGDFRSSAYNVSDDGSLVVGQSSSSAVPRGEAFRWSSDTGLIPMGVLPSGSFKASVSADVSGDGGIIVGSSSSLNSGPNTGGEAFRWTAETGMVGLGDLPGASFMSSAGGISRNGKYIVGQGTSLRPFVNQGRTEAFLWSADTGMIGLGTMHPNNDGTGSAQDVSDNGHVVGAASGPLGGETGFYWTPERGMISIRDLLLEHGIDSDALGWQLSVATGISADGLTIVGAGTRRVGNDAISEGWVVHLPSPAATPVLLLAASTTSARRRRP